MNKVTLLKGDCLQKLKELKDNSVDSVVTDPPYEIGFMGKGWDDSGIANNPELWKEVLRVLKPGGHLLSFSHSRTYHRQAVAVEDAGFEIRDQIMWIYGSGFPKSHNIGKAVDKIEGNEREVVGVSDNTRDRNNHEYNSVGNFGSNEIIETKGHSPYEGWGTALKPAHEPIVMARKPFKGNVANNVLEWGTGGINVDGCRIGSEVRTTPIHSTDVKEDNTLFGLHPTIQHHREETTLGRFPANIIFDEEAGKILDEQSGIRKTGGVKTQVDNGANQPINLGGGLTKPREASEGGASRFFYCPKSSKKDRNEGMPEQVPQFTGRPRREDGSVIYKETHPEEWAEVMKTKPRKEKTSLAASEEILQPTTKGTMNTHPTVKPTDLMAYLIRLITPKGGLVLDPFMGSGSTGKAAVREGMNFIGIEREDEYMEIAKSRIDYELKKNKHTEFFNI
jgi:site-specific DNA-methyltransferase (adenine-specific)